MDDNKPTTLADLKALFAAERKATDAQFSKIDDRFTNVDSQFDKFASTIVSLDDRLNAMEANMATKDQVHAIYDLLDKNIREHELQEQERIAMSRQINRLNKWVRQIADKTATELRYE